MESHYRATASRFGWKLVADYSSTAAPSGTVELGEPTLCWSRPDTSMHFFLHFRDDLPDQRSGTGQYYVEVKQHGGENLCDFT